MKLKFIFTTFLIALAFGAFSQGKLNIKVTDAITKETLNSTSIVFPEFTKMSTVTDIDGNCSIPISKIDTYNIKIQYVGYESQEKKVVFTKLDTIVNLLVELKVATILDDVLVVGYGTVKKREEITPVPDINELGPKTMLSGSTITVSRSKSMFKKSSKGKKGKDAPKPAAAEMYKADSDGVYDKKDKEVKSEIKTEEKKLSESDKNKIAQKTLLDAALDIRAGRVTASENSDLKHWAFWNDKKKNEGVETHQKKWGFLQFERYPILVTNDAGFPLSNVAVTLKGKDGKSYWSGRTDNLGNAEIWCGLFEKQDEELSLILDYQSLTKNIKLRKSNNKVTHLRFDAPCKAVSKADICFIVDATGSMGDEINYLKQDLGDVVNRIKKANPTVDIRLGSVFYRDNGDEYLTHNFDFSSDLAKTQAFFDAQSADGGGDFPEAVDAALGASLGLTWRDDADAKIAFLLLDAPPHDDAKTVKLIQQYTMAYAKKGIKIIPISGSGVDKSTEYLMRFMALATNGTYTYLTDDSGVGDGHIDATVSEVSVEFLNNLLTRIINQNIISSVCAEKPIATLQRIENQQSTNKIDLEAKLFPVPAIETITLDLSENVGDVTIFALDGKAVLSLGKRDKGQHKINISSLAAATYFMQIVKDGVLFGEKFVVLSL